MSEELIKQSVAAMEIRREEPSIGLMLQAVVDKGVTNDNVAAIEKLVGLYERMQDRNAEREFAQAFVQLQLEIPKVLANKSVPNKDGTTRYKFAPLEEIDRQLRPMALRHGFTYSFSEGEAIQGKVTKICVIQHKEGHKRSNPYTVRIGQGPPGSTETQGDGAAHTYAKRGALCDAFGIIVEQDTDGRLEGGTITQEQANDLRNRVQATGSDEQAFLKFAGSDTFEGIKTSKLGALDQNLRRKERTT
jgi:hypothetical protein